MSRKKTIRADPSKTQCSECHLSIPPNTARFVNPRDLDGKETMCLQCVASQVVNQTAATVQRAYETQMDLYLEERERLLALPTPTDTLQ